MISYREITERTAAIGSKKAHLSLSAMFLLAVMAGAFIALAACAFNTVTATIAVPSLAKLLGALVFPAGLSMVLICGSELFTGNAMSLPMALFFRSCTLYELLRNWLMVYIGNWVGSLLIAWLWIQGGTGRFFDGALGEVTLRIAAGKLNYDFQEALILGILCNILVCLGVWMATAGETVSQKLVALYLPILCFVLCGFEHSIANMFFIPAGLFLKIQTGAGPEALTWSHFMIDNLIPVTIGNTIGGVVVALAYRLIYVWGEER